MGLLKIDADKCKRDGLCVAECPTVIIHQEDKESAPEMVPGGELMCLRCGHCVAVCPHGAVDHAEIPLEACPPIRREDVVTHEQAIQFLRSRRSIRVFKDKSVEKETFQHLIEIARYAPTASNAQMVEWVVIRGRDKVRELAERTVEWMRRILKKDPQPANAPYMPIVVGAWDMGFDAVLRNAPALVVAMAPKEDPNGMVDLTLALSYMELVAPSLGLGTCWAGLLQGALLSDSSVKRAAGIPEDFPHHYPIMVGYAMPRYYRMPERKAPKILWK